MPIDFGFSKKISYLAVSLVMSVPTLSYAQNRRGQVAAVSRLEAPARADNQTQIRLNTVNEAPQKKRARAKWKIGLSGASFSTVDRTQNSHFSAFDLGAKLDLDLVEMLSFTGEAQVLLMTGQAQVRYLENVPSNLMAVREALLNFKPFEFVTLSAGAVDQGELEMPLLVNSRAFPGAVQSLRWKNQHASLELRTQQTIPTAITLTTRTSGNEQTPTFFTETVRGWVKPIPFLKLGGNASTFRFHNLPSQVAFDSQTGGNFVLGQGPLMANFAYEFRGWTAGGFAQVNFAKRTYLKGGLQALQNTAAPEGFRNGQMAYVESGFYPVRRVQMKPRAELFFNESDSAPAFYNAAEYGHNNRRGYAVALDFSFDRQRFKLGSRYIDANTIEVRNFQARQQTLLLTFETLYADF